MISHTQNKKGYSLMELVIVISIFIVLMIVGSDYIVRGFKSIAFENEQTSAIAQARKSINIMATEVRKIRMSDKGDYPVSSTTPQFFSFYADIDNDLSAEKVTYFASSSKLYKTVSQPGALLDYTGTTTTSELADFLNNQTEPIFSYYNASNTVTALINQIRLVNINLKINVTPEIAPNDYYVETDVNLRNLKDNL